MLSPKILFGFVRWTEMVWLSTRLLVVMIALLSTAPAFADPERWRAEGWKTAFEKTRVPLGDILSGGPPRDGIPSIDDPKFIAVEASDRYAGREPVIELVIGSEARAYPLSVLTWHEIVNDVVGGRPVAVTYCPLCNASIVFDRRLGERTLEFGTTGKLRNSDLIMYDRQTETWWQQFSGEAIIGDLVGNTLKMLPSRVVSFADFKSRYPQGMVLVPNDPGFRSYGRNPYVAYDSRSTPYPLFRGDLPENMDAMARVVVVRRGSNIFAVTLKHLRDKGEITLDGVELRWSRGVASALDRAEISRGRDVGSVNARGSQNGEPVVHDVTFAFVLFAFHPDVSVLTENGMLALKARR